MKKQIFWLSMGAALLVGCVEEKAVDLPSELFTLNYDYDPIMEGSPYRIAYDNALPDFVDTVLGACMFNRIKMSPPYAAKQQRLEPWSWSRFQYTQALFLDAGNLPDIFRWCDPSYSGNDFANLRTKAHARMTEDLVNTHHELCHSASGAPSVPPHELSALCPIVSSHSSKRAGKLGFTVVAAMTNIVSQFSQAAPQVGALQNARTFGVFIKDPTATVSSYGYGLKTWTGCHYRGHARFFWGMVLTDTNAWWNDRPGFANWKVTDDQGNRLHTAKEALSIEFKGHSSYRTRDTTHRQPLVNGQMFVQSACGTVLIDESRSEPKADGFLSDSYYSTTSGPYFRAYSDKFSFRSDFLPFKENGRIRVHQAHSFTLNHLDFEIADNSEFEWSRQANLAESLTIRLLIGHQFEDVTKQMLDKQLPVAPILEKMFNESLPKNSTLCGFTTDGVGRLAIDYLPEHGGREYFGGGVWIDRTCSISSTD